MTSLILGAVLIYLSFTILRMPGERFRQELDQLTGRGHGEGYYQLIRWLVRLLGLLGIAAIVLRFF